MYVCICENISNLVKTENKELFGGFGSPTCPQSASLTDNAKSDFKCSFFSLTTLLPKFPKSNESNSQSQRLNQVCLSRNAALQDQGSPLQI